MAAHMDDRQNVPTGAKPPRTVEMVNVLVTAEHTVRYRQIVRMTKNRWTVLKKKRPDAIELDDLLDPEDVYDADDITKFELVRVDQFGKPLDPLDKYEPPTPPETPCPG